MTEDDLEKLRLAVRGLDPKNDGHWTKDGLPDCNALKEMAGFAVTRATLVTHGLNAARTNAVSDEKSDAEEIKQPGAVPENLNAAAVPRALPELETVNENTTLHRNKKALQMLQNNISSIQAVLSGMTKMSGTAQYFQRAADEFGKEVSRGLARLG